MRYSPYDVSLEEAFLDGAQTIIDAILEAVEQYGIENVTLFLEDLRNTLIGLPASDASDRCSLWGLIRKTLLRVGFQFRGTTDELSYRSPRYDINIKVSRPLADSPTRAVTGCGTVFHVRTA
jgi:hypothetical protein